jgi:hypothetical protein
MMLEARLFSDYSEAKEDTVHGDRVHILQFLFDVDTARDCHRPIPMAIIKSERGLLSSVNINRLRIS